MTAGHGCNSSRRNGRTISLHVRQKEFQDGIPETGDSWSHAGEPWIWRLPPISENMAVCHISPGVRTVLLWICIIFWKKNISVDQKKTLCHRKKHKCGNFKVNDTINLFKDNLRYYWQEKRHRCILHRINNIGGAAHKEENETVKTGNPPEKREWREEMSKGYRCPLDAETRQELFRL